MSSTTQQPKWLQLLYSIGLTKCATILPAFQLCCITLRNCHSWSPIVCETTISTISCISFNSPEIHFFNLVIYFGIFEFIIICNADVIHVIHNHIHNIFANEHRNYWFLIQIKLLIKLYMLAPLFHIENKILSARHKTKIWLALKTNWNVWLEHSTDRNYYYYFKIIRSELRWKIDFGYPPIKDCGILQH